MRAMPCTVRGKKKLRAAYFCMLFAIAGSEAQRHCLRVCSSAEVKKVRAMRALPCHAAAAPNLPVHPPICLLSLYFSLFLGLHYIDILPCHLLV